MISSAGAYALCSAPGPMPSILTDREREVVQLIAEGRLKKEIGHNPHIAIKMVENHRTTAMHKPILRTTAELIRYAVRNQIVEAQYRSSTKSIGGADDHDLSVLPHSPNTGASPEKKHITFVLLHSVLSAAKPLNL
jgi:DNA-binding CsgD family transcriptional regulator